MEQLWTLTCNKLAFAKQGFRDLAEGVFVQKRASFLPLNKSPDGRLSERLFSDLVTDYFHQRHLGGKEVS